MRLAARLDAHLSAVLCELHPDRSAWPSSLGTYLVDISSMIGEALSVSHANRDKILKEIQGETAKHRVVVELLREVTTVFPAPESLVEHARIHDLTILPTSSQVGFERWFMEAVIFGSGAPTLLLPEHQGSEAFKKLDTVVIAWDFSRAAARALRDALPLLTAVKDVRVLSVLNEKHIVTERTIDDLKRHLSAHGISFAHDEVDIAGSHIGDVLRAHVKDTHADMLVMGAFGHSRVREFILGGATASMLLDPPIPVFLSH